MYSEKISIKYKLAEKEVLIPLSAFLFVGMFLIANFLLNLSLELIETTFSDLLHPKPFHMEIGFLFRMPIAEHPIYYLLVFLVVIGTIARTVYKLKSSFKNLNNHEKGSSRFTTVEELKKQYRAVPDREETFKGGGGVVISRLGDKVFIDDSPVNNLIIGTTRSGKGETYVFPTIDVYSRAEHKPSLIFNDPKGELFSASKETLEERGYHIEVLNLLTPLDSMSYNLLQLVKDAYKDGDYSTVQALCKTLSHTLYYKPGVKDPFWQDCAMSLCNAMILAITDKCIAEGTEEKITMYAVANMLSELGSKEIIIDPEEPPKNALDLYFENLPSDSVAKMQYATSNFSKGQARGGIFTQTMNGLSIFTFDEIAKMTAKNSVDLKRVGFGKTIKGKVTPRKRIEIVFPDGSKESIKSDITGRFALDFKKVIKVGDTIQFNEKGNKKKKTSISIMKIDEKTGDTEFKVVEENEDIQVITVDYFDKPVAIFMITPDFDSSNHVIASIFVRQLYFILAKGASLARGGKCHREVVFCLDEFGNMPSIEGMANIITVCLGRNVRFNLVIQAYAQLKNKYGEDADTIDGNCGNTIYILTNDQETAEKVSKKLGNQTINLSSRSGKGLSTDKNKTESLDQRPLLTANELMNFKEGESAVIRVIKRQDNNRKRIRPRPIYNTGETALKYRWEYLGVEFDTDKSILDIDIDSLHDDVNPNSLIVDFLGERKEKPSEPKQEDLPPVETMQPIEEPTMMGIDEEIPEEAFQQEDSPFDSLSIENWKEKTVNEFFESDLAVLKLVDKFFLAQLGKSIDEVENQEMGEFYSEFQMLAHNDHIDKSVYQAVENKINRILRDLEEKEQVTS
ncbi:VirD4-like conjugal transfer protein, CD1115 family [Bacillus thuringiensis]|uniref:VirD4-like conjugal transfer protein, CD1115 family n=1 Tax=Bacillus thuringiensis TaxID=1428 RepID=UPI000BEC8BA8|nr:type IV secretory system conjugative DNA transfer family protein [Bacillus thuringiensis]MEC2258980.1 type IV secretory system conjugative DNA transfer family protein [Bacillus cereus]PEB71630.1 ATPase [Bacillus thuringiensis]PFB76829.1 ATPase [Bacillus thuringiensis]PFM91110.1 ATPase [Bacillus thuringiensis]PGM06863.1 ATPase [Bacillus thuringiensis]